MNFSLSTIALTFDTVGDAMLFGLIVLGITPKNLAQVDLRSDSAMETARSLLSLSQASEQYLRPLIGNLTLHGSGDLLLPKDVPGMAL